MSLLVKNIPFRVKLRNICMEAKNHIIATMLTTMKKASMIFELVGRGKILRQDTLKTKKSVLFRKFVSTEAASRCWQGGSIGFDLNIERLHTAIFSVVFEIG